MYYVGILDLESSRNTREGGENFGIVGFGDRELRGLAVADLRTQLGKGSGFEGFWRGGLGNWNLDWNPNWGNLGVLVTVLARKKGRKGRTEKAERIFVCCRWTVGGWVVGKEEVCYWLSNAYFVLLRKKIWTMFCYVVHVWRAFGKDGIVGYRLKPHCLNVVICILANMCFFMWTNWLMLDVYW